MVTLENAREATASIVEALHPVSVTVFGSVAREGTGNDLDLLVVTDAGSKTAVNEAQLVLHGSLKKYYRKFPIDPFVVPLPLMNEYLAKGSPFLNLISREGRVLYMKDAVKEWLRQAGDELNMAAWLMQGGFFKGACYHAQQSVEKALKARLLGKGWELEKTHSIERLIALGEEYGIQFDLSDEEVVFLDSIYRGRYPAEAGLLPMGEPSESEGKRAVDLATRVFRVAQAAA